MNLNNFSSSVEIRRHAYRSKAVYYVPSGISRKTNLSVNVTEELRHRPAEFNLTRQRANQLNREAGSHVLGEANNLLWIELSVGSNLGV